LKQTPTKSQLLLWLLVALYSGYFSWYTINRHNTLNSYAADLSLIDQPMWNTARGPGGFMELTWGNRQQPRLAEHFEPVLVPLSLLFWLWDDVRILLIAQSVALALGALPVFWIARNQFSIPNPTPLRYGDYSSQFSNGKKTQPSTFNLQLSEWAGLALAAVYLLAPHLQAANIADFHADPFVVTPLLLAFWYASQRRWGWMWLWAVIIMLTKETLPTLSAMLGFWLAGSYLLTREKPRLWQGLGLILVSTVWFGIATFGVVAPLARQYFGTDGPIYFANRFDEGLTGLWPMLQDPARWRYLAGLLASVGFLPLLAPELLALGLPVLAANLFSNFAGQYSGEQHYSAPLTAVLLIAAIYGARRLMNWRKKRPATMAAILLWLIAWALGFHALRGWTPLSLRMENYRPTPASQTAARLITQIPPEAPVSASAGLHPHVAHRQQVYVFPTVEQAEYLLVDVTDVPGVHPNDARTKIMAMLDGEWQLLQARQGLILAQRNEVETSTADLPAAFFDFARAPGSPAYPLDLAFGDGALRLTGFTVLDDPDDGVIFRFYWQATRSLPDNLRLWPLVYDDNGQLLSNPAQVPMIALLWYPPQRWQTGETIVTETLPQMLPSTFHLGIAAGPEAGRWVQVASFKRQGPFLTHLPPIDTFRSLHEAGVQFGSDIQLLGYHLPVKSVNPGDNVAILLQWQANQPIPNNYTIFVHVLGPDGELVAQQDGPPFWLAPQPTSQWPVNQPVIDNHRVHLPDHLSSGRYAVQTGLYHPETMERLVQPNGANFFKLGEIWVK